MKGTINTTVFVIAAIAFLFIVLVLVVDLYGSLKYMPYSTCWGVFQHEISSLEPQLLHDSSKARKIELGDCVSVVIFVNNEKLDESLKRLEIDHSDLNCNPDKKAYIIAIPILPSDVTIEWGKNPLKWPKRATEKGWNELKKWWKEEMGGIKPECKGLNKEFYNQEPVELLGPDKGIIKYCVWFERKPGNMYEIHYEKLEEVDECE